MSTQVLPPPDGHILASDNILPATNITQSIISHPSTESISKTNSLETPLRDDDIERSGAGMTPIEDESYTHTDTNNKDTESEQQETENSGQEQEQPYVSKHSSLRSDTNPLTMARQKKIKEGTPLIVKFDERVVVHTVPYWDPCGDTFYETDDDDQGPRGPTCCIVL